MKIDKIDLNIEEVEVYYSSNNLNFYKFTSFYKLAPIEDIDVTYAAVI